MYNKKIILVAIIFVTISLVTMSAYKFWKTDFKSLPSKMMHTAVITGRNYAINQAVKAGKYRCCINPPCTMCYEKANKWNNNTPGTCACDDFIARGEEPCPQCEAGETDIHSSDGDHCDLNSSQAVCDSIKK